MSTKHNTIPFYRVDCNINGNPRYVVHFLDIMPNTAQNVSVEEKYRITLNHARKFGGQKYRAKWFGGGIVFTSYYIEGLLDDIQQSLKNIEA